MANKNRFNQPKDNELLDIAIDKSDIDQKITAKFFITLFNNSPIGIYIIQNGKFKFVNNQFQKLTGYSPDELQGIANPLMLVHPKDRNTVRENARQMLRGDHSIPYQYRYIKKDGNIGWAMETIVSVQNSRNSFILGSFINISKQKNAEKEASDNQEYYHILFEHYRDAVFVITPEGRYIKANPAACQLLGYGRDELIGMSVFDVMPPGVETPLFDRLLIQGHVFGEINLMTKNGSSIIAEINATELPDGNYLGTVRDITERMQMEEKVKEGEEKYRQLVKYAPAGIYEVDFLNLRFTSVNDIMCQYTGYTREEFLAINPFDILCDESKNHFSTRLRESFEGQPVPDTTEFKIKGKNGHELWVIINAKYIYRDGFPIGATVVAHNITERKKAEETLRLSEERFFKAFNASPIPMIITSLHKWRIADCNVSFLKNTGCTRNEVINKMPIQVNFWHSLRDVVKIKKAIMEQGAICNYELTYHTKHGEHRTGLLSADLIKLNSEEYVLITINDITERKRMEEEMARLEGLNLIGEMAAGIGHEIRNPMTSVRGFLQMLINKEDCSKFANYFNVMIDELDRANSIITEFLSLAKNKPSELKAQSLNKVVAVLEPLVAADSINSKMNYHIELGNIADIILDEKQIRQLILNLVRNGLEAMEPGGTITIRTLADGDEVVLIVRDEGSGISPTVLKKIGIPFVTTKDIGTGLGLAVCYGIAARHSAKIKVQTGSSGTTFFVRFPPLTSV